jgi:TnpA family transposase
MYVPAFETFIGRIEDRTLGQRFIWLILLQLVQIFAEVFALVNYVLLKKALKNPEINQTGTKNSNDVTIINNIRSTSQCISASTKKCSSTDLSLVYGQKWKGTHVNEMPDKTAAATVHSLYH